MLSLFSSLANAILTGKICMSTLQAALPVLLFSRETEAQTACPPSTLQLHGGTDADFAPPIGYMQKILLPTLRRLWGLKIEDQVSYQAFSCGLPLWP